MFEITNRMINQLEATLLIEEIKQTPNIIGYSLKEWVASEYIMIAENENINIAGACLNYDFHEDWCKIAALFVLEEFRGLGLGRSLFYKSCNQAMERGKNIYTISANPIVIKMMKDLGFLTFENLKDCPKEYKLILFLHSFYWILDLYRIREVVRKKLLYQVPTNFLYGVKIIK